MDGREPAARLLLVELLHDEICHREWSMLFPFVQGLARAHGVPTCWVIAGVDLEPQPGPNLQGRWMRSTKVYRTREADMATLDGVLAEHAPTHIVTAGGHDPAWQQRVEAVGASSLRVPTWLYPAMALPPGPEREAIVAGTPVAWNGDAAADARNPAAISLVRPWLDWLGIRAADAVDPGDFLVEHAAPDFEAAHLNAWAERLDWSLTLVSGAPCLYGKRVKSELLASDEEFRGCSFCKGQQPWVTSRRGDPFGPIAAQIRDYQAKRPVPEGRERVYDVYDARLLRRIDRLAEVAAAEGVTRTTFSFSVRVDELLRTGDLLDRVLPRFAEQGNRILLEPVGIESFSEAENRRLNKGLTEEQVAAGVARLQELELAHPDTFRGLMGTDRPGEGEAGFIQFTPWTSLEDVAINLRRGEDFRFPPNGRWLIAMVFLLPGTAMTAMAAREERGDILCERFDDATMELLLAVPNHPDLVLPWRFLDPEVARYYRVVARYWGARNSREGGRDPNDRRVREVLGGDPLFSRMRALMPERQDSAMTVLAFAKELFARLGDGSQGDEALVDAILGGR